MITFLYSIIEYACEWFTNISSYITIPNKNNNYENSDNDINNTNINIDIDEVIKQGEEHINFLISRSNYNSFYELSREFLKYECDISTMNQKEVEAWFNNQIYNLNKTRNISKKVQLLLLKIEYLNWIDIKNKRLRLNINKKEIYDDLTLENYLEILSDC